MLDLCCCMGFSSCGQWGPLSGCGARASRCRGFSCCGARDLGTQTSVVASPRLGSSGSIVVATDLVAVWHVGFSWTGDWTPVSCSDRRIPSHWAAREAPSFSFGQVEFEALPVGGGPRVVELTTQSLWGSHKQGARASLSFSPSQLCSWRGGTPCLWKILLFFKKITLFFRFWPCHAAYGILVSWPGFEPGPLAVKAWSLNRWTTKKFPSQRILWLGGRSDFSSDLILRIQERF